MKRLMILSAALLAATPALAGGTTFSNSSTHDYDEIYLSAPGKAAWGENLAAGKGEGVLDVGKSFVVEGVASGTYDVKLYDPEDPIGECTLKGVTIDGQPVEVTKETCG